MNRKNDLSFLASNEYWGRGVLIGNTGSKTAVAYFIMGRSENSRNRYFYQDGMKIAIAPYDIDKLEDPSLIIYYPIKLCGSQLIVTNGDQTDTIEEFLQTGRSFEDALRTRKFEPDAPHFTPRISGLVNCFSGDYKLSILKNDDGEGELCERFFYEYGREAGNARFIHTYEGNGTPLPVFTGEPKSFDIPDDIDVFTSSIWNSLNDENKISLCVVMIDNETKGYELKILNKRMGD